MIITQRKRSRGGRSEFYSPKRRSFFQEKQNIIYTSVTLLAAVQEKMINMLGELVSYATTMIEGDQKADSPQKIDGDPKVYTYSFYYTSSVLSSEG